MISVDSEKCIRCGACIEECPNYVFASLESKNVQARYPDQCCVCGHCIAVCPVGAIVHSELPSQNFSELAFDPISPEAIRNLLLSRRSVRVFNTQPVPESMLRQLIEVGVHAGTSSNGQTEGFIILQDSKKLSELEKIVLDSMWDSGLKYLSNSLGRTLARRRLGPEVFNQVAPYYQIFKNRQQNKALSGAIFRNAPVIIVAHDLRKNPLAPTNCALALRNMEIIALTLGLGTCWVGFLVAAAAQSRKVAEFLQIPGNCNVFGALMTGFPKRKYKVSIPRKERSVRFQF